MSESSKMRRRVRKEKVRAIHEKVLAGLCPEDDALRAARVRDLCPCEFVWKDVPLWDIIVAACNDESPLVRHEALHVIEDAWDHGIPMARAMKHLYAAAASDPSPEVRRYARELVEETLPKRQRQHRKDRAKRQMGREKPQRSICPPCDALDEV